MSSENIEVKVQDKVDPGIATNLRKIAAIAKEGHGHVSRLQQELDKLKIGNSFIKMNDSLSRSALIQQRLQTEMQRTNVQMARAETEMQRTAAAGTRVHVAMAKLAEVQNRTQVSSERLAQAQNRTAASALAVERAQSRSAAATAQLTAAQNQSVASASAAAAAQARLLTAQTNSISAAQRLATIQQQTATATANTAAAQARASTAATQGATAAQNLATAQQRGAAAAQNLATAQQRTAAATSQAAAAASRADSAALRLQVQQQRLANSVNDTSASFTTLVQRMAAIAGSTYLIASIGRTVDAYTTLQNKLQNVADTQPQVAKLSDEIFNLADRTRSSVTSTATAFSRFDRSLKQMGKSQEDTLRMTETVNKGLIVSGATASEASSALLQLSQAFNSGRLQGDEFRSLSENMPMVLDAVAKALNAPINQVKKLSTEGKITSEVLYKAFGIMQERVDRIFGKTKATIGQAIQVLSNNWTRFMGKLDESLGITSKATSIIFALAKNLDAVAMAAAVAGAALLVYFGPALLAAITTAGAAVTAFTVAVAANPIGLLVIGATAAISAFIVFGDKIEFGIDKLYNLQDVAKGVWSTITQGATSTAQWLQDTFGGAVDWIFSRFENIGTIGDFFGSIVTVAKGTANLLIGAFVAAYNAVTMTWQNLPVLLQGFFNAVDGIAATAIENVVNYWQKGLRLIGGLVNTVAPGLADSLNSALDNLTFKIPRLDTTEAKDAAAEIAAAVSGAFKTDYLGDVGEAIRKNALIAANARRAAVDDASGVSLRGAGPSQMSTESDNKKGARAKLERDNELRNLKAFYDQRASVLTDAYSKEKRILDARRSGELVSEEEYLIRGLTMAQSYETQQVALLEEANNAYLTKYAERYTKMQAAMNASKDPKVRARYQEQLQKEANDSIAFSQKTASEIEKIQNELAARTEMVYINLESTVGKLRKTDLEFWEGRSRSRKAEQDIRNIERGYASVNESIFSSDLALKSQALATARVAAEIEEQNSKLAKQLSLYEGILLAQRAELDYKTMQPGATQAEIDAQVQLVERLSRTVTDIRTTLTNSIANGIKDGAEVGFNAFDDVRRSQFDKLTTDLADAVYEGITGDGKKAGQDLRNMLQKELIAKPLTALIKGTLNTLLGGVLGGASSAMAAGAEGGMGGAAGLLSTGMNVLSIGKNITSALTGGFDALSGQIANYVQSGMNLVSGSGGMISQGPIQVGALAQNLGAAASIAGGVAGGVYGGRFISGGYSALGGASGNSAVNTGTAAGAALGTFVFPGLGTALGSLVGGLLGGTVNRLFGRKLADQGIQGTFGGDTGFEGESFKYLKGGLFRSDKTETSALSSEIRTGLAESFNELRTSTKTMAGVLGLGTSAIDSFTTDIKLSLNGLSDTDAAAKIAEEFDKIAESLAGVALADANVTRIGETSVQALTRLSTSLAGVNGMFETLGLKLHESSIAGAQMASELVTAAGGLDTLTSLVGGYYKTFYTEEERMFKQRELQMQELAKLNLYIDPYGGQAAKDLYKDTVNAALSTGQNELAVKLLAMSTSFGETVDYMVMKTKDSTDKLKSLTQEFYGSFHTEAETALHNRKDLIAKLQGVGLNIDPFDGEHAKGLFRQAVENALATGQSALYESLLGLGTVFSETAQYAIDAKKATTQLNRALAETTADQLKSAYEAMNSAGDLLDRINAAMGGPGNAYSVVKEQRLWAAMATADYKQQIDLAGQLTDIVINRQKIEADNAQKMLDFGKSLRTYVNSLKIGELSPLTTGQKLAEAAKQYTDTLAKAKLGDSDAMAALQGASTSYLELARTYFASSQDYTNIFNSVTGALDALGVSSQTEAERQLEVASSSLDELRKLQSVTEAAYAKAEADTAIQKAMLQTQVDAMLRTAGGIEAVQTILSGLATELALKINTGIGGKGGPSVSSLQGLAQQYVGLVGDKGGSNDASYVAAAMANLDPETWNRELQAALGLLSDAAMQQQMRLIFENVAKLYGYGMRADGSHASGLGYVPRDNYLANLHQGERVLTRYENEQYSMPTWSNYDSGDGTLEVVAQVKVLIEEVRKSSSDATAAAGRVARTVAMSSQANAEEITEGVEDTMQRATYGAKLKDGGKYK